MEDLAVAGDAACDSTGEVNLEYDKGGGLLT